MGAAPGWYSVSAVEERYWDGEVWTEAHRPRALPVHPATPAYYQPLVAAKTDGMAIAALVLGIVSLLIPVYGVISAVVGVILGAVSMGRCQPRGPRTGRGMALAGLICSIVALVLWVLLVVLVVIAVNRWDWEGIAAVILHLRRR